MATKSFVGFRAKMLKGVFFTPPTELKVDSTTCLVLFGTWSTSSSWANTKQGDSFEVGCAQADS